MRRIKVAHLGIAHDHSTFTMECAKQHPEIFEIVGICEPDADMMEIYGKDPIYEGVNWMPMDEILNRKDIEAVFCEGHELRSVAQAQACIDAGKHVHLDKPGGIDIAQFEHLLKSAEEKNLTLQMGYMYRWNPAFKYIQQSVKEGKLGEITGIDGTFSILHPAEKRKWLKQFPGGMMFYIGCHVIDMIMLLMGTPTNVYPFNKSSDFDNDGSMDSSFAVLEYPHAACTVRSNATETNGYFRRKLLVAGTKGSMEICPLECPTIMREAMLESITPDCKCVDASRSVFPGYLIGRYDDMLLEFAACVRGEMKNPISAEYELDLQKVLLKACM